ncbi:MAG: cupin domain-containing protein [Nonomuraea sp.]|nr:cupin domain-containing protein [Nonomuraea sp.]
MADNVVARKQGEGDAYWLLGGLYEVLASGAETGGAMTVMQMTVPAGMGPPPHTHPGSETVYVLEGTLEYHIGDETVEGGPGSCFHVPAGTWENFEPTSAVRLLVTYLPGGIDEFFAEVGERASARVLPPSEDADAAVQRFLDAAPRYGMQMREPA